MPDQPRYIFLSHNSADKSGVEELVQLIEKHSLAKKYNLKVWLDKYNLENGVPYTNQFSRNINDVNTCAFVLFMPEGPIRAYVEHEINVAFDRQMNDKNEGKQFPLLPVYPQGREARQPLPEVIGIYNYIENVLQDDSAVESIINGALSLKKSNGGGKPIPDIPDIPPSERWLCFDLTVEEDTIVSQTETGENKTELPLDTLLATSQDRRLQITIMQQLFPSVFADENDAPKRLRVRTDDPALAMLPWAMLHEETVVEVSPIANHYRPDFDSLNISTPLVIIPNEPQEIASNTHYRLLQEYCTSYFNIRGPIPRLTSTKALEREIVKHKPDLIYLYARVSEQGIQLDDSVQGEILTLDQLATCIKTADIRPMVVLSLLGNELTKYPESLAQQCRLLWIQSTNSKLKSKSQQIEDNLANTLEMLSNEADLIKNINSNFNDQRITHHLWANGQSPELDTKNYQLSQQLRAALLRVLLGRKSLKNNLYGEINQLKHTANNSCLSYAVSGDENACPFDVPAQIQQRLDWDNPESGLPIIAFHLPLTVSDEIDTLDSIETIVDSSLVDREGDIRGTFQGELDRRGLEETASCIALNWNITIPPQMGVELSSWLTVWGDFMTREVIADIPSNTMLLNAICLQVADSGIAQEMQDTANNELARLRRQKIGLIRVEDALGKLKSFEISDFFEDNPNWREALKLDTYNINPYDYADWIHQRCNQGEFEQTVNLIWQQYQSDYQDYP